MTDNIAIIIASAISAVGGVLAMWAKNYFEYKKRNTVESSTVSGVNIYEALGYIQSQSQCSRAYVFEFHNGEHFFSGRGQQKFSCTYEFVKAGVSAEALNSQNHRISNFNQYIHELVKSGGFKYLDITKIEDNPFKEMLKSKGVTSIYNVPIKTLNGKIIGILGIEYTSSIDSFPKCRDEPDLEKFMRRQARIISGYLI